MTAQVDYPVSTDSQNTDHVTMPRAQYERMCDELDRRRPGSITPPGAYTIEEGDTLTIGGRKAVWRDHIWHWASDEGGA